MSDDSAVRETANDAAVSKLSAITQGYYVDPYMRHLVRAPARRPPLINRGYYARVGIIDLVLRRFLTQAATISSSGSTTCGVQIVALGGGMATTFFRLHDLPEYKHLARFVELDLADSVRRKVGIVSRCKALKAHLEDMVVDRTKGSTALHSKRYHVATCDLRDMSSVTEALAACDIDYTLPTLFLSECVLIYLSATHSDAIIEWVAQHFVTCSFVSYEQINPHDAFGKVMVKNMQARGLTLQGIETYPTIDSLRARYTAAGWQAVVVADMKEAYDKVLPEPERKRVASLEFLDEVEQLNLMHEHYTIAVATCCGNTPAHATAAAAAAATATHGAAGGGSGSKPGNKADAGEDDELDDLEVIDMGGGDATSSTGQAQGGAGGGAGAGASTESGASSTATAAGTPTKAGTSNAKARVLLSRVLPELSVAWGGGE